MLRYLIVFLLFSTFATAGPWPRGKGRSFVSYTISTLRDRSGTSHLDYNSAYAEYGLTEDYTLGLDVGFAGDRMQKVHVFLRFPPDRHRWGWMSASDFGIGVSAHGNPTVRSGVTVGRDFKNDTISGWVAMDFRSYFVAPKRHSWLANEITLGFNLTDKHKAVFQWQDEYDVQDKYAAHIASSLVWEFRSGHFLETGLTIGLINTNSQRLRIGLWHEF